MGRNEKTLIRDLSSLPLVKLARIVNLGKNLGLTPYVVSLLDTALMDRFDSQDQTGEKFVDTIESIELKIRQQVEAGHGWKEFQTDAWALYARCSKPEVGARLAELAYIHGTIDDVILVMDKLSQAGSEFYFHLSRGLRTYFVLGLVGAKKLPLLFPYLEGHEERLELTPVERLVIYLSFINRNDIGQALMYYRQYEHQVVLAVEEYQDHLSFNLGDFYLQVAKIAIDCKHEGVALPALQRIPSDHESYEEALNLVTQLEIERDPEGHSLYAQKLRAIDEWQGRIKLFYSFFNQARASKSLIDNGRPILNDLLESPLNWVPETPQCWQHMSQMLMDNVDLHKILPKFFDTYVERALDFNSPTLDLALWQPILQIHSGDVLLDRYWQGVANLHLFVLRGVEYEDHLWKAQSLLENVEREGTRSVPIKWESLHRAASLWVAKSPSISEKNRSMIMRMLRVATNPHQLAMMDVIDYLDSGKPGLKVLEKLQTTASMSQNEELRIKILEHKADKYSLTNGDLSELWKASVKSHHFDLSWRVCTIVQSRSVLKGSFEAVWGISGEKRSEYPFNRLGIQQLDMIFTGCNQNEKKFLQAVFRVGWAIPSLLHSFGFLPNASKVREYRKNSPSGKVSQCLDTLDWLPKEKNHYLFDYEGLEDPYAALPFALVFVENNWTSTWLQLANRMGVSAWGWRTDWLLERLNEIVPRYSREKDRAYVNKMGKWLRSIGPTTKGSWYELISSLKTVPVNRAKELLILVTMRLSTVLYQNHAEALHSVQVMKLELPVLRALESWIVSSNYSALRQKLKTINRVPVPPALQRQNTPIRPSGAIETNPMFGGNS